MGYAFLTANCFVCHCIFTSNPVRVPTFKDKNGVKQPVCSRCIERINSMRKEKGLTPFVIPADAYNSVNENELI